MKNYKNYLKEVLDPPFEAPLSSNHEYSFTFLVPVMIELDTQKAEKIIGNYMSVRDTVSELEREGYIADWIEYDFENWKRYNDDYDIDNLSDDLNGFEIDLEQLQGDLDEIPNEMEDEKESTQMEINELEEQISEIKEKIEKLEDMDEMDFFEKWLDDDWGNWGNFLNELGGKGEVEDFLTEVESKSYFNEMKEDFNESELEQYMNSGNSKDLKKYVKSIRIVGDNFERSGVLVEVITTKEFSTEDINVVREYISGQCSDGWGEGYSQREIDNKYFHTWWFGGPGEGYYKKYYIELVDQKQIN